MENGRQMLLHSVVVGLISFLVMRYVLGQGQKLAENRSLLLAAASLIYMIIFGHGMPNMKMLRKNLF